jgi:methylenetetrahydrofolate reductase (NADPH)
MKPLVRNPGDHPPIEDKLYADVNRTTGTALQAMQRRLLSNSSIELTSSIASLDEAGKLLPAGMSVFVPSLPNRPITGALEVIEALKGSGFDPVPHLAARRLPGSRELRDFLRAAVSEAGVRSVLLVGGDVDTSHGPYDSAEAVLRSGVLQQAGIASVGVAGYPEPHPKIPESVLEESLANKVKLIGESGMDVFIATQFSLDPAKLVAYCAKVGERFPEIPLMAGIPGPTSVAKLVRYARFCGVGTSMRTLRGMGLKAARIGQRNTSDQQVRALAEYCIADKRATIRGVHVFSFGGFVESAKWIRERVGRVAVEGVAT